jgi:hypothetical protein
MNYTVDETRKWEYENGFYLTCPTSRIGKLMSHLEIYRRITDLPGDVLEFGVYKGTSLVRLLSFRHLLENDFSRKVVGFDAFGKFPDKLSLESDREFVKKFESGGGGYGNKQGRVASASGTERVPQLLPDRGRHTSDAAGVHPSKSSLQNSVAAH